VYLERNFFDSAKPCIIIAVVLAIVAIFLICKKHKEDFIEFATGDIFDKHEFAKTMQLVSNNKIDGLDYVLTERGIVFLRPGQSPNKCNCDDDTQACVAECTKQLCGENCHVPHVENFIINKKSKWFDDLLKDSKFVNATHLSESMSMPSAPDLMPGHYVETLNLVDKVKDNIVGRMPGVEGKGIKKLKVRSKIDNRVYIVRDFENYQEAADQLALLNKDIRILFNHIEKKYPDNEYAKRLLKTYNFNLVEETPKNLENLTSYTVDKKEIFACLREKNNPHHLHDHNLLLYVMLHELAHMSNVRSWGHDDEFYSAFGEILGWADEIKILKRISFEKHPVNYCGLPITNDFDY